MSEDELRSAEGVRKIIELLGNTEAREVIAASALAAGALHRGPSLVEVIQNATA
jgi:hypothetical protein